MCIKYESVVRRSFKAQAITYSDQLLARCLDSALQARELMRNQLHVDPSTWPIHTVAADDDGWPNRHPWASRNSRKFLSTRAHLTGFPKTVANQVAQRFECPPDAFDMRMLALFAQYRLN